MQYIDKIIIHNFKSFKHANIKFSNGFTCIAGPNGSGKSNICDALLFALGETSLKRMRVNSAAHLISDFAPKNDEGLRTYVKIFFSGNTELEVLRAIRADKVIYKVNGKRVKRQDMIGILRENGCDVNYTNTITQGEISQLLELNPKERRELIDIASGIKEFDIKKSDAIKELEKVESKIANARILYNERYGFLEELKKEKEQAERYLNLSNTVKRINYTLLKLREEVLSKNYEKAISDYKMNVNLKKEIEDKLSDIEKNISHISVDREVSVKKLNERSIDANANNRAIEHINKNMAVMESKISNFKENRIRILEEKSRLEIEKKELSEKIIHNKKRLTALEEELKSSKIPEDNFNDIENENNSIPEEYERLQTDIESIKIGIDSIDKDIAQINFDFNGIANQRLNYVNEIERVKNEYKDLMSKRNELEILLNDLDNNRVKLLSELSLVAEHIKNSENEKSDLISNLNELRQQIAAAGMNSDKLDTYLKEHFKSGFYGRASELCTYDNKYAAAVGASVGSRLNFFVVDSIAIAEKAISYLREKSLGRATFIPLKDVKFNSTEERKNLKSLISCITFDDKFSSAFQFIFSNTYIIESVADSKKYGIGNYRYVTLNGELVETSGIVSGGSIRAIISIKKLQGEIKEINEKIDNININIVGHKNKETQIKNTLSEIESKKIKESIELNYLKKNIDTFESQIKKIHETIEREDKKSVELKQIIEKLSNEKNSLQNKLAVEKEKSDEIYSRLVKIASNTNKKRKSKEEIEHIEKLKLKIDELKASIAGTIKENELSIIRIGSIEANIKEHLLELKTIDTNESAVSSEMKKLNIELEELKEKMNTYDKATKSIYTDITTYDKKIAEYASEKGRILSNADKLNRSLMENETLKAQLEVRIGDIRAELSTYTNIEILDGKNVQQLDVELAEVRGELDAIGAVNLKAPEIFEQKKVDVEDAQKKLDTVEMERSSVMEMIEQIETKKVNIFNETFDAVNKNFKELYSHTFPDKAELIIDNPKDIFNSGLTIQVKSDKKIKSVDRYSGGEKALVMLMLIFGIQMRKPMAFYIFDEIDAALDKENSKKLSMLIKELSKNSQFIVVSHNDSMIVGSQTNLGVMKQNGESKAVGVMFSGN